MVQAHTGKALVQERAKGLAAVQNANRQIQEAAKAKAGKKAEVVSEAKDRVGRRIRKLDRKPPANEP